MPEEWAASGARLLLPIDVAFDAAPATEDREPLLGERQGTCKLRVAEMGRFVGPDGEVWDGDKDEWWADKEDEAVNKGGPEDKGNKMNQTTRMPSRSRRRPDGLSVFEQVPAIGRARSSPLAPVTTRSLSLEKAR